MKEVVRAVRSGSAGSNHRTMTCVVGLNPELVLVVCARYSVQAPWGASTEDVAAKLDWRYLAAKVFENPY